MEKRAIILTIKELEEIYKNKEVFPIHQFKVFPYKSDEEKIASWIEETGRAVYFMETVQMIIISRKSALKNFL